ncbi:hypothetical protein K9M41_00125 [Candidatus Gracilibacteria bacterium]|nr:hypothetical protein [Candidatus Gracilibacteria bacterium]
MFSQINFIADAKLKQEALAKAKHEGVTLKTLLNFFLKSYCRGEIELGLKSKTRDNVLSKEELGHYLKAKKDLDTNKNIMDGEEVFVKLGV